MKTKQHFILSMLLILTFGISHAQERSKDFPVLKGPYLGLHIICSLRNALIYPNFAETKHCLYFSENEDGCWTKPQEYGEFSDARDGQKYRTIKIGCQIWMAENLNFKIEGSWWYENKKENGNKYGRLYTWKATIKACPEGWHLPTEEEWKQLEKHLGMSKAELDLIDYRDPEKRLKTKLQKIGFSLPMAGCRTFNNGDFLGKDEFTFFWSATPYKEIYAWKRAFDIKTEGIGRHSHNKKHANSVRYIKDK